MSAIPGIAHYEERMLFTLMLLRHPRAHLVYLTSVPLHPAVVDYMVSLVRGVPAAHVRERLTLLSTFDGSPRPLSEKLLERPRLLARIRRAIDVDNAHMTCFTVSSLERSLAVQLGIPLYGVDPDLLELGTKSGSRRTFREAGVPLPPGREDLRDETSVVHAVAEVWEEHPDLSRVLVKQNEGFSGEGNAVLDLEPLREVSPASGADRATRMEAVAKALPTMRFGASDDSWPRFRRGLEQLGGVVEAFLEGKQKRSPSAQLRINPRGELEAMSTHDQLLGGPDEQAYQGCLFPADEGYRLAVQQAALEVGEVLRRRGVIGRVAVDFVAVRQADGSWNTRAIEINLRMTGTTHPLMLMRMLNDGSYEPTSGLYRTARGDARFYLATDTLYRASYRGLLVEDLLDIAAVRSLHYKPWTDTGTLLHLVGSLSQYGKLGVTCVGETPEAARGWYDRFVGALDEETLLGHPALA
jgi:hypothetical protein